VSEFFFKLAANIWQSYKQERGCFMLSAHLANTLLKDEESARGNHVFVCNFAKYLPHSSGKLTFRTDTHTHNTRDVKASFGLGLSLGLTLCGLGPDLGLMASGLGLIEIGLVASNIYGAHDVN